MSVWPLKAQTTSSKLLKSAVWKDTLNSSLKPIDGEAPSALVKVWVVHADEVAG